MRVDKETVADALRSKGDYDRAQQAACALPRTVDTDRDAGLIHQFDLDVAEVVAAEDVTEDVAGED
ncbi:MAG TPA: hypothetical protein VLA97_13970 [Nocardioidaceae bacterium]|nr:hypothetical protein [Nocardioidaceae bacterium]